MSSETSLTTTADRKFGGHHERKFSPKEQQDITRWIIQGKSNVQINAELNKIGKSISRQLLQYYRSLPDVQKEIQRRDTEAFQSGHSSRVQRIGLHKRVLAALCDRLFDDTKVNRFKDELTNMDIKLLLGDLRAHSKDLGTLVDGPTQSIQIEAHQTNNTLNINGSNLSEEAILKALHEKMSKSEAIDVNFDTIPDD